MVHKSIETPAGELRASAASGDTASLSDEELSVALRAAGASPEDVHYYLNGDRKGSKERN